MSAPTLTPTTTTTTKQPRITEEDADYQRVHATAKRRLAASIALFVRDLRRRGATDAASVQAAFVHRHTRLLARTYAEGHAEGQRDYWGEVSLRSRHPATPMDERWMRRRLTFYLPSVVKMAREGDAAWRAGHMGHVGLSERDSITLANTGGKGGGDPLAQWQQGLGARLTLQAELSWSGLQDGYAQAGKGDPASPFAQLWWILGFVKTEHCSDCLAFAANSPYDRPGSGGNELDATPGDGSSECGASCKCHLAYEPYVGYHNDLAWEQVIATLQAAGGPIEGIGDYALYRAPEPPPARELTDGQKRALDLYRATRQAWDAWRGDLPPLPEMFSLADAPGDLSLWARYGQMTPKQKAIIDQLFEALGAWNVANAEVMGIAPDALYGGGAGDGSPSETPSETQLAEWAEDSAIRLYNVNHDARGRFAPGGLHGRHEQTAGRRGAGPHEAAHHTSGIGGHGGGGGSHGGSEHSAHPLHDEAHAQRELVAAEATHRQALDAHQSLYHEGRDAQTRMETAKAAYHDARQNARGALYQQELRAAQTREPGRYAQYERLSQKAALASSRMDSLNRESERHLERLGQVGEGLRARGVRDLRAEPEYQRARAQYETTARERAQQGPIYERASRAAAAAADRLVGARITEERINSHPAASAAHAAYQEAVAHFDATRARFTQAERDVHASALQIEVAKGKIDLARGGTGVRFDFKDAPGEPGSTQRALNQTFGREVSNEDLAKLSGARLGDRVFVAESGAGVRVWVRGNIERNFEVTRQGNDLVLHDNITRNMAEKTSGSGRDLIQGFDNMRAMGITKLEAQAARGPTLNGYHTWARLGFTGKIPDNVRAAAQSQFGSHITRVEQLMAHPGGAGWWKQHGDSWEATFDFHDGSHSMKVLNEFRAAINRRNQGQTAGGAE